MADKDQEPIQFTEEFRRAKRNALFWAAVTILVSLGSQARTQPVEVTTVLHNLAFSQSLLTTLSLVVLAFMFLGYHRAEAQLLARHTGFAYAARMTQNVDIADRIAGELQELQSKIASEQKNLPTVRAVGRQWIGDLGSNLASTADLLDTNEISYNDLERALEDLRFAIAPKQTGPFTLHSQMQAVQTAGTALKGQVAQWRSTSIDQLKAAIDKSNGSLDESFRKLEERYSQDHGSDTIDRLRALTAQLRGFASAIGATERRWFYLYDRAPVWALSATGAGLAIFRLVAPDRLTAIMQSIY